jgi:enamine deaminase RidA (YjgF/YER057c/UK114 family)
MKYTDAAWESQPPPASARGLRQLTSPDIVAYQLIDLKSREEISVGIDRLTTNPSWGFADAVTTSGAGRMIHISGNVGFGDEGKVVSGGMGAEARATFANIEKTLHNAGADMSHVVKITAFVTSLDNYGEYVQAREEVFGDLLPASSTVQVAGLLVGAQIEIEAVAFVPDG